MCADEFIHMAPHKCLFDWRAKTGKLHYRCKVCEEEYDEEDEDFSDYDDEDLPASVMQILDRGRILVRQVQANGALANAMRLVSEQENQRPNRA